MSLEIIAAELHKLNSLVQQALPPQETTPDFSKGKGYKWHKKGLTGYLESISDLSPITLDDLQNIDEQKEAIRRNTEQFVRGLPANNVLLTGSRGCGKSSVVKALLNTYAEQGLRIIEVDKDDLYQLPLIVTLISQRPEKFIVYCDDLSFQADDASYRALKTILDGGLHSGSDNVLIYATSNRRHLLPEFHHENNAQNAGNGEIHPGETVEDKLSLSDRFGIWLSFYPNSQDDYLRSVSLWLSKYDYTLSDETRRACLQWALARGNRSSRTASQFARDWVGKHGLKK